ncbi:MAG: hypothetical protein M3096_09830 [Actinomycetia bacterium]|nr:hypothetical protein [Actinomycetes bacterium]
MKHVGIARYGVWLVAVALTAAACGGVGGVDDGGDLDGADAGPPAGPAGSDTTVAFDGVLAPATPSSGDGGVGGWGDLCDSVPDQHGYLVEIGLLDEGDLSGLPVPFDFQTEGYWTVGPLGTDGAAAVGESLTDAQWLCGLDPTPELIAALGELDVESISDVPIDEIIDIVTGAGTGDGTDLDVLSPGELQQLVRDLLNTAALAQELGNVATADGLIDAARDVFAGYAEIVKNAAHDPAELLSVVAGAQLLGLDELADEVLARVEEILEGKLADAGELFTPCTTDPAVVRIYFEALARVQVLVQDPTLTGEAAAWIDVQERRLLGEEVPECEGAVFSEAIPLEGWDGTLEVHLTTCGYKQWAGRITASGTLESDGALMTLYGEIPLEIFGDPGVGDFAGLTEITLTMPEATGEGQTVLYGTAYLELSGGEVELTLFFSPGTFDLTIEVAGMTVTRSQQIDWDDKVISGTIVPLDALCTPEG